MTENTTIEYEHSIEDNSDSSHYDREVHGRLEIDGPNGKLVVTKRFRAMLKQDNDLMETGKIHCHDSYYRASESEPFTDGFADWSVDEEIIADKEAFANWCEQALLGDPELEYERQADRL